MASADWQTFNRTMTAVVQQLRSVEHGGWQVRVLRLHDVVGATGYGPGEHAHAWTELSQIASGCVAYRRAGDERELGPGAVFCMPGGERHAWRAVAGPALIVGYHLQVAPTGPAGRGDLATFNARLAAGGWSLPPHPFALAVADEMHAVAASGSAAVPLCSLLVRAHLAWLLERLAAGGAPASATTEDGDRLDRLREHVLEHLAEPLSLTDLAQRFGVSERHLNRMFNAAFGSPLHRFIIDQRLDRASHTLVWRDDSVAVVARSVGYDDPGYFGRLFRSRFGRSPERWRQAARRQH